MEYLTLLQIDVLQKINDVGGPLALVMAVAVVAIWMEYKAEKKQLAQLNASVRKDALDNLRIIDGLANQIRTKSEHDEQILMRVTETLALLKAKYRHKLEE